MAVDSQVSELGSVRPEVVPRKTTFVILLKFDKRHWEEWLRGVNGQSPNAMVIRE